MRYAPARGSEPMSLETQERLIAALEKRYPGKARRAVDVCPVAVNKTIDNEADAQETLRRLAAAEGGAVSVGETTPE